MSGLIWTLIDTLKWYLTILIIARLLTTATFNYNIHSLKTRGTISHSLLLGELSRAFAKFRSKKAKVFLDSTAATEKKEAEHFVLGAKSLPLYCLLQAKTEKVHTMGWNHFWSRIFISALLWDIFSYISMWVLKTFWKVQY